MFSYIFNYTHKYIVVLKLSTMNSDTIFELSKYVNVDNLLKTSKQIYSMGSEAIYKNLKKRALKDFVHIETEEATIYLVHKVADKGRIDLLMKFVQVTPFRNLALIVTSSVIMKLITNAKDKNELKNALLKVDKIIELIKPSKKDLEILYILTKDVVPYPKIVKYYKQFKNIRKLINVGYKHRNFDIEEYINSYRNKNKVSYEDLIQRTKDIEQNKTIEINNPGYNKTFHELLNYETHIEKLIITYNFNKEELFKIRIEETNYREIHKQRCLYTNKHIDYIPRKILQRFGIEKIDGLFLIECYYRSEKVREIDIWVWFDYFILSTLSRKYNLLNETGLDPNKSIASQFKKIKFLDKYLSRFFHGFIYEAYKYKNISLINYYLSSEKIYGLDMKDEILLLKYQTLRYSPEIDEQYSAEHKEIREWCQSKLLLEEYFYLYRIRQYELLSTLDNINMYEEDIKCITRDFYVAKGKKNTIENIFTMLRFVKSPVLFYLAILAVDSISKRLTTTYIAEYIDFLNYRVYNEQNEDYYREYQARTKEIMKDKERYEQFKKCYEVFNSNPQERKKRIRYSFSIASLTEDLINLLLINGMYREAESLIKDFEISEFILTKPTTDLLNILANSSKIEQE